MVCEGWAVSEDVGEVIFRYTPENIRLFEGNENACFVPLDRVYAVAYYRRSAYPSFAQNVGYNILPKLYAPMDLTALEAVGADWAMSQPALRLTGQDVLIGFLDTGIDLSHRAFLDERGGSRLVGLWDQTDTAGTPPEGIGYGSAYTKEQIDALLLRREAEPGLALPGRDETGHGTFLAGAAAGSRDRAADFSGAAPGAMIAAVKLKPAKRCLRDFYFVREGAEAYQEDDLMMGLRYLTQVQREVYRPMVVCLGMGSSMGGHVGNSALARMLGRMSTVAGVVTTAPTGNEANAAHHFYGNLDPDTRSERVEIRVPEHCRGFTLEMWADVPERYQVGVRAPGGETIPDGMSGRAGRTVYEFYLEGTTVYVDYRLTGDQTEGQLIRLRFDRPSPGIWEIDVRGRQVIRGRYHMWLPVSEFVEPGTAFLKPDPDVTLTEPSSSGSLISVAGYNHHNGSLYLDSGRGFARLGQIRPDAAAPAVQVYGPLPGGRYGNRTGTSAAAALTAGVCADLLEWGIVRENDPFMNQTSIKDYLIRGAERTRGRTYPNKEWGFGTINLEGVFRALQG